MKNVPKKGDSVAFRRPFIDPQIRQGEVSGPGFNAVAVETGVKGKEETSILCVSLDQVLHVR